MHFCLFAYVHMQLDFCYHQITPDKFDFIVEKGVMVQKIARGELAIDNIGNLTPGLKQKTI